MILKRTITFHNMEHSAGMEGHANLKLNKIEEFLKDPKFHTPKHVEIWLKANPQHPHHEVDIKLKTPQFDLFVSNSGPDMYLVIDGAIDKMVTLLKKEKSKINDNNKKKENDKRKFEDDKYNL